MASRQRSWPTSVSNGNGDQNKDNITGNTADDGKSHLVPPDLDEDNGNDDDGFEGDA